MIIIGIAGGTGSGKTTVVRKIISSLPAGEVAVLPQDCYYRNNPHIPLAERRKMNYDEPASIEWELLVKHLAEMREGHAIEMPTYDMLTCARMPETVHVEPKPVIIIEGIMTLLNKKLREMMDLKIFVDTDPDERLIRNIRRDVVERGRTVEMVIDRYLDVLKPMHEQFIEPTKKYADLIVPQGGDNKTGISILKAYIEGIVTRI